MILYQLELNSIELRRLLEVLDYMGDTSKEDGGILNEIVDRLYELEEFDSDPMVDDDEDFDPEDDFS